MGIRAWAKRYVVTWASWFFRNRRRAAIGVCALQGILNNLQRLTIWVQDMQRLAEAAQRNLPSEIFNFDRTACLTVSVMSPRAPWLGAVPAKITTPAMITHEEALYYTYIGSF
jgi:hypothetical protein